MDISPKPAYRWRLPGYAPVRLRPILDYNAIFRKRTPFLVTPLQVCDRFCITPFLGYAPERLILILSTPFLEILDTPLYVCMPERIDCSGNPGLSFVAVLNICAEFTKFARRIKKQRAPNLLRRSPNLPEILRRIYQSPFRPKLFCWSRHFTWKWKIRISRPSHGYFNMQLGRRNRMGCEKVRSCWACPVDERNDVRGEFS